MLGAVSLKNPTLLAASGFFSARRGYWQGALMICHRE